MDSRKTIIKDTAILLLGELIGSCLLVGVFAAFGAFSWTVVISALVGSIVITANYFLMAVVLTVAADRAAAGELKRSQQMTQLSSTLRLVGMGVVLLAAIKLGANAIALALPLLFMRPVLMLVEFFGKKGD